MFLTKLVEENKKKSR